MESTRVKRSPGRAIFRGMPGNPAPVATVYYFTPGPGFRRKGQHGGQRVEEVQDLNRLVPHDAGEVESAVPRFQLPLVNPELADLFVGQGEAELVEALPKGWGQP